jgi:hypothetical protein
MTRPPGDQASPGATSRLTDLRCPRSRMHPETPSRHESIDPASTVMRLGQIGFDAPAALLFHHGLQLQRVAAGELIPGSFWGDEEAGIIGTTVYARDDTPVHSLLHEAGHLIVLPPERRPDVHTDATDSIEEEDATCYLQIVLADQLAGVGRDRLMADMDAWGYSFRLGSTRAWFERDADNARDFLQARGLPHV